MEFLKCSFVYKFLLSILPILAMKGSMHMRAAIFTKICDEALSILEVILSKVIANENF